MKSGFDEFVTSLRAAAEPSRIRLLVLCDRAELTVSELTEILGQSQPRVSRHLKLLCEAGLLVRVREGTNAFYRASRDGVGGRLVGHLVGSLDPEDKVVATDLARLEGVRRHRTTLAAAYFRRNAAEWDRIRALYVDEAEVEAALLDLVPADHYADHLDVGTGTGRILEIIGPRAERAVGVDLSREMLAIARTRVEQSHLASCRVRHGDMYTLPWPAASFDLVTFHLVLHYADDPAAAIAEAARVLRPEGRLIVVDFAPHELEFLRAEHAHRRLGLGDQEVAAWIDAAGLGALPPVALPGSQLTVKLWAADRPAASLPRAVAGGPR